MNRKSIQISIDEDGQLEVLDPGFDSLSLLREIDPDFKIHSDKLPLFTSPRVLTARVTGCGASLKELTRESMAALWALHAKCLAELKKKRSASDKRKTGEASLLDLKTEIARRILFACHLCSNRCGANRINGETGICCLGPEAYVDEHFIHITEESFVNPSLILSLRGCGLRCCFCQHGELLEPLSDDGVLLNARIWQILNTEKARSLSFVGGNPDQSIYAILKFLSHTPSYWSLPIVWNCNSYATIETVRLLEGIVDVYIADFKYGSKACGELLSAARSYPDTAKVAIAEMLVQDVPVIVRILVLPEHFDCCHSPALEYLASIKIENLYISVRGQYSPKWKITDSDGPLARRTNEKEIEEVRQKARLLNLSLVD